MAINFTTSYTFTSGTTISSSQVNTNFSDISNVFTGLEAETKTLAKLKLDADPTTALEAVTKQYVDHLTVWRRPNLQFGSVTTVAIESGLDGTAGDIPMLFPDGSVRTETSTTRTTFNITRNAVLVTSGAQSGLTGATSEAVNTWYASYAVKVTDSSTLWVHIASTVIPTQGNFATLNTAYGTNGWVYLGMSRNGDNSGATGDILQFGQCGNQTSFYNNCAGSSLNSNGIRLATTASATSLTYTYAAGTGAAQIPAHLLIADFTGVSSGGSGTAQIADAANAYQHTAASGAARHAARVSNLIPNAGLQVSNASAVAMDIYLSSFKDGVLGVGSNPLL